MKKSFIILLILGILVILLLAFLTDWYFQKTSEEEVISANGTIEYISLEGGFYGIVTDEGEKYLPLNLPEEFKKDGLRVWFKAKPKNVATIQMWGKPIEILEIKLIKVQNLSQIKVAVQYRYVTDGKVINRSLNKVIKILKETKADFIFQGWMTQEPCPDKCSVYLSLQERKKCNLSGYNYEHLKEAISKIKKELPDIIFCGGTQAEYLYPEEAGKSYLILEPQDRDKAWEMALNPEKWGIEVSKKDFQCYWAKRWGDIDENEPCPSEEELKQRMRKYFPDLTNPNFQKILLERIYKQIDAGVDAIWIDMLYVQGRLMAELTKDPNHPAVKESYKAAFEIVEKIREYGERKGKYIYVITWVAVKDKDSIISVPKEYVNVDAAMVSPSPDEIKDKFTGEVGKFNERLWDELVMKIKEDYGIPIFARIDYGGPGRTQLYVFSQELSKEEARDFLRKADQFFSKKGIIFIYPVHGGDMGRKEIVKKLSYGKFNWYDSLASEFETYETIKDLAQKKKVEPEPVFPEWINEPLFEMIQLSKKGTLTFKEQEKMLPLLAEMGIKTIYLTPIWEMCENPGELRRYCIKDYYKIDPEKGTEEDLKEFVEKAHSYGMKVILDLVTAHTSPGRYIYENHKDWILKDKYGRLVLCWPHKHWGYAVDRKNPKVIEHFTKIAKYYVDKFGIDGWRVDAIGTMYCNESIPTCPQPVKGEHHSKDLLKSIKSALGKDKALYLEWCYLGRLYLFEAGVEEKGGCPYPNPIPCSLALPELNEYADASYSYEFGKCFMKKILAGKITSQDFVEFFKKECLYYGKPRGRFLMTHDFGYQFYEKNPELHKLGAVLITTIPGFPHIYHREIFPEGDISSINQEMFNFYKKLLKIRERHKALKYGSISNVWKSGDNVIAYLRKYEDEKVIVMVNLLDRKATSYLDLSFLPKGSVLYDELNDETFNVNEPSNFKISIPKYGSRILILKINRSRNAKT